MMMTKVVSALMLLFVFAACVKKEPAVGIRSGDPGIPVDTGTVCGEAFIADYPVKVGETGIVLPVGTKICITKDELEVRVELPVGFQYVTDAPTSVSKPLPVVFSTYTCACSKEGNPCQVFYADGLGFGCLQSSCAGSCTGKFTYMGYSVDKVISTMDKQIFFSDASIQEEITKRSAFAIVRPKRTGKTEDLVYVKQELYGINYYLLVDKSDVPASLKTELLPVSALCECEGTKACTLRTVSFGGINIYFCDGLCNGCELTIS